MCAGNIKNKNQSLRTSAFIAVLGVLVFGLSLYSFTQQEEFKYDAKGKRDPFIALVTPDGRLVKFEQEGKAALQLEGIIYDPNGVSFAIVNGEIVKIGDWAADYQVLKIEENKVTFIKEGQTEEIELEKEEE